MSKKYDQIMANIERDRAEREALAAAKPAMPALPDGPTKSDGMSKDRRSMLLLNIIFDLEQPRKDFDEMKLAKLAANIGRVGVLNPVKLRWSQPAGKWIVVCGERRVRASRIARLTEIPFGEIPENVTRDEIEEIQLVENIQRDDLKPSELAASIKQYIARKPGRTQKEIAAMLGLSEATISNVLAVSELPVPILNLVDAGAIPTRVGAELAAIKDEVEQVRLAEKIVKEGMNRVDALAEVQAKKPPKKKARKAKPSNVLRINLDDGYNVTIASMRPLMEGEPLSVAKLLVARLEQEKGRAAA